MESLTAFPADYEKWPQMFRDQAESGLTVTEWCRKNHLSTAQFNGRMQQCRRRGIMIRPPRRRYAGSPEIRYVPARSVNQTEPVQSAPSQVPVKRACLWERILKKMAREQRVYLVSGIVKRPTPDRLRAIVEYRHRMDPYSGDCFVFRGRNARQVHMLMWDGDGFLHTVKRSEKRPFRWPREEMKIRPLTEEEVGWLFLTTEA